MSYSSDDAGHLNVKNSTDLSTSPDDLKGERLHLRYKYTPLLPRWFDLAPRRLLTYGTLREGPYSKQGAYFFFWNTAVCAKQSLIQKKIRKTGKWTCCSWLFLGRSTSQVIAAKFEDEVICLKELCTHVSIIERLRGIPLSLQWGHWRKMSHVWSKCNRTRTVKLLKQNRDTYPNRGANWNGATNWYLDVFKKEQIRWSPS